MGTFARERSRGNVREGTFARRDGGQNSRVGTFARRDGGHNSREGTFARRDGGENSREGTFARGDLQGHRNFITGNVPSVIYDWSPPAQLGFGSFSFSLKAGHSTKFAKICTHSWEHNRSLL